MDLGSKLRIDAHIHGMHAVRNEKGILAPPLMSVWNNSIPSREMIRENHSCGIEKVLALDPPEIAFSLREVFGEFVIPIPQVDMDHTTPEEIDGLFARGAAGIKFIAPMHPYGDDRYFPLYRRILAHNGLAVFHTGFLVLRIYDPGYLLGRKHPINITAMRPAGLDRIGRAFPDLKILMAHFGNPWWEEAWCVIRQHKNIYADLSGGTAYKKPMAFWRDLFAPEGRLDVGTVGKLCYASDGDAFHPGECSSRPLMEFYDRLYETLKLPDELIEKINRRNILELLT